MGGNDYLKLYGGNWIPKLKHESDECFARRLSLASFSPYFTRIIQAAIGLILRKPIKLEGADEEWWAQWRQNVDRQAGDLEAFAKRNLTVALAYGHCGILADYPQAQNIRTLRDEYDANLSPYLMNVEPWRIIGWREDSSSTVSRLDQVRIRETTTVPRGMFGEETWRQIRVLSPGRFEVYRASAPQETGGVGTVDWRLLPGREGRGMTGLDEIPLSVTYAEKLATLVSMPILQDVAFLNLRHYRLQSKHLHALEVAGFPMLTIEGWDDTSSNLDVDVTSALALPIGGGAQYVEPASSSFAATQEELADLVQQMSNLGISVLAQQKMVGETAKAKQLDRAETNSVLSIVSISLEKALQAAVDACAEYAGREAPMVSLDRDFDLQTLEADGIGAIVNLYTSGLIDRRTGLELLQRGEILTDEVDIDDIIEQAEQDEAAAMEKEVAKLDAEASIAAQYAKAEPGAA